MTPGPAVVFGAPRSFASKTLAFPQADSIGLRRNYFGASFEYIGGREPVALPGRDRNVKTGLVTLDGSASFSESGSVPRWNWTLVARPAASKAELSDADTSGPSFTADVPGIYIARLVISDGSVYSAPSTVSIAATSSSAVVEKKQ
jgi:hypothetical protein